MGKWLVLAVVVSWFMVGTAAGQSSSLYVQPAPEAAGGGAGGGGGAGEMGPRQQSARLAPAVAATSFMAVRAAEPRRYAVHDLVTIVVRELSQADSTAKLETEKEMQMTGAVTAFPDLTRLLEFQLAGSGLANPPRLDVRYGNNWEGEGKYARKDSVSDRITARVIDVKPNGLLVLEARKSVTTDRETLQVVLTGTCRAEDVGIDNTVLSTQLYDLKLDKQHEGELRRTTKKGIITRVLEGLFNF